MTARITIQSGIAAGTSHLIDSRVARVGSDPSSDVCLPTADIPAHALTLEFRDSHCRVYNRCQHNIYIGTSVAEPEQVVPWPETDVLQLGQDIELLIDLNHDESANFLHELGDDAFGLQNEDNSDNSASIEVNPKKSSPNKTMLQLGVTIACLIGCAMLLIRDQNRRIPAEVDVDFSSLVSESLRGDAVSPKLIRRLQYAEALRVRGRSEMSEAAFQAIRDDLIETQQDDRSNEKQAHSRILNLVQSRIGSIKN